MELVLHPRAAPQDRLRVWLGVLATTAAPELTWHLDGAPVVPVALRALTSVRTAAMLPPGLTPLEVPRAFSGVYEFRGLQQDTLYTVTVRAGQHSARLETRTLPDAVPTGLDRWFNVLLVSCFHQAEDRQGLAGLIVSQLPALSRPHLTLCTGDQVYLDLPTLQDFPDQLDWLASKFETDYTLNWRDPRAYARVLQAAPSVAVPDDHEYWNNFPHPSPFIGNSRTEAGRRRWHEAAQAMYAGFQLPYPAHPGAPVRLDIAPLSFFIADTRSQRDAQRRWLMPEAAHGQMAQWVDETIASRRFGVFVTGQSLFTPAPGRIAGAVRDYALPNYDDYGRVVLGLRRLADAGRPVLCLTGDVHWGRVVTATDIRSGRAAFLEVISSPLSLVTTVGLDQIKKVGAFFGDLFGPRDPWPRHSDPDEPPAFLASEFLHGRFPCTTQHRQSGNHCAVLGFRQHGSGIAVRLTYWPVTRHATVAQPRTVGPITLAGA